MSVNNDQPTGRPYHGGISLPAAPNNNPFNSLLLATANATPMSERSVTNLTNDSASCDDDQIRRTGRARKQPDRLGIKPANKKNRSRLRRLRQNITARQEASTPVDHTAIGKLLKGVEFEAINDFSSAAEQYRLAAKEKIREAIFRLAIFHERNIGDCTGGYERAAHLYREAGLLGLADAWNNLGLLYQRGHNCPTPDHKMAGTCFEKAIETGHCPVAHYHLGIAYEHGKGVTQDINKSREHYLRGAEGDEPDSQYNLAVQYEEGHGRDPSNFGLGISQCYQRAAYWYERSMNNPLNDTKEWPQYAFAKLCINGHVQGVADSAVLSLIKQSAAKDFTDAMIELSKIKLKGLLDEDKDPKGAVDLLNKVIEKEPDNGEVHYQLAIYFFEGSEVQRDIKKALEHLNNAKTKNITVDITDFKDGFQSLIIDADIQKDPDLLFHVAKCYDMGFGNDEKVLEYYRKAKDAGSEEAKTLLPELLHKIGIACLNEQARESKEKGVRYLGEAAALGNQDALQQITNIAMQSLS